MTNQLSFGKQLQFWAYAHTGFSGTDERSIVEKINRAGQFGQLNTLSPKTLALLLERVQQSSVKESSEFLKKAKITTVKTLDNALTTRLQKHNDSDKKAALIFLKCHAEDFKKVEHITNFKVAYLVANPKTLHNKEVADFLSEQDILDLNSHDIDQLLKVINNDQAAELVKKIGINNFYANKTPASAIPLIYQWRNKADLYPGQDDVPLKNDQVLELIRHGMKQSDLPDDKMVSWLKRALEMRIPLSKFTDTDTPTIYEEAHKLVQDFIKAKYPNLDDAAVEKIATVENLSNAETLQTAVISQGEVAK
jgi:hypothetical protein